MVPSMRCGGLHRMNPNIVGPMRVWLKDVPAPGLAMSRYDRLLFPRAL